jgi:membrane protease YdiL (CAAX protease family)
MNNETFSKIKIPFIGGTILLTLFCLAALLFVGVAALVLGSENEIILLVISQIGMWLIPALLFAFFFYENSWTDLNVKKFGKCADYGWFILLYLVALPLIGYLAEMSKCIPVPEFLIELSHKMETQTKELISRLISGGKIKDLLSALLVMAVLPAVCEEVFFRGVVLNNLLKRTVGIHLAVWISAILFSTVHFEVFGFLSRMLLGATLGYAFVYSKSLWLPIILHFLNNAALVFAYFFAQKEIISENVLDDSAVPHWAAALSIIAGVFVLRLIFNRYSIVRSNCE